ncbi:hypothetical protein TNCV_2859291 [Trichonephila clavipes]|nr:hypothetical protein TNCV_2859291 [Trichonephila clavipes]
MGIHPIFSKSNPPSPMDYRMSCTEGWLCACLKYEMVIVLSLGGERVHGPLDRHPPSAAGDDGKSLPRHPPDEERISVSLRAGRRLPELMSPNESSDSRMQWHTQILF